ARTNVERHNCDQRKNVDEYGAVMTMQWEVLYTERDKLPECADLRSNVVGIVEEEIKELVASHLPGRNEELWDLDLLIEEARGIFPFDASITGESLQHSSAAEIEAILLDAAEAAYDLREEQ